MPTYVISWKIFDSMRKDCNTFFSTMTPQDDLAELGKVSTSGEEASELDELVLSRRSSTSLLDANDRNTHSQMLNKRMMLILA